MVRSLRLLVPFALAGTLAVPAGISTASTQGHPRAEAQPAPESAGRLDRDHDRIDDRLDRRLARLDADHRLSVIVTGVGLTTAERAVGSVQLRHRLPLVSGFSASMTAGQVRALAREPGVRRIEPVTTMRALDDGTNRDFGAAAVPV